MPENEIDAFAQLLRENQPQTEQAPEMVDTPEVAQEEQVSEQVAEPEVSQEEPQTEETPEQDDTEDVLRVLNGDTTEVKPQEIDYTVFKEVLGKEVKSTDEIKEAIASYKETVSSYEKQLSSLPVELRTAMEVAQNGGDYLAALGVAQIDYKLIPAADFVRTMFPQGAEGDEKFNEFIESAPSALVEFQGNQLREQAIQRQQAELNYIRQQAIERKQANETAIRKELDGITTFLGNKVTAAERQKVYEALSKGLAGEYKRPDGSIDAKRAVTEKMIIALAPTLIKNAKHQGATEAVKRVVTQAANVNLNKTNPITPFTEVPATRSPLETYLANLASGAVEK